MKYKNKNGRNKKEDNARVDYERSSLRIIV